MRHWTFKAHVDHHMGSSYPVHTHGLSSSPLRESIALSSSGHAGSHDTAHDEDVKISIPFDEGRAWPGKTVKDDIWPSKLGRRV